MTLADRIEADLATRLRAGEVTMDGLRLVALAAHYQTSTRPVRIALARLREKGASSPRSRRIRSAKTLRARPLVAIHQAEDELYMRLARDMVEYAFRDDDQFLRENHTAEKYGVSTTVVREIFNRLVGQGMMEHVARRGWRVRKLTQKDLDDFIEVRESLETKALHLAWNRIEPEKFKAFLDGNVLPRSTRGKPRIDNAFHGELIRLAQNHYISEFFERHGRFFEIVFAWEDQDRRAAVQAVEQHQRILKAILDRDLARAKAALVDHIRNNHPLLSRILSKRSLPH
jgi:DNA-binding GntR family transcriptional regulator